MNEKLPLLLMQDYPLLNAYKCLQTFVHGFIADFVGVAIFIIKEK